jgi:release factor glutamine methyltransferase
LRAAGCVFAEEEAALLVEAAGVDLDGLVARRVAGEPLEHVLGWVELAGRRWSVGPGVFVPRRRSELLVDVATTALRTGPADPVLVDLCCGCGAVGGAVLLAARAAGTDVVLHASDLDAAAVRHAEANLASLGAHVHRGDLFGGLPAALRERVSVLVCHAPYVPTSALATMPREAREHEPLLALDGGSDGLDVVRRVAVEAPDWLAPGGMLLVEVGEDQVAEASSVMRRAGLVPAVVRGHVGTDDDSPPSGLVLTATLP